MNELLKELQMMACIALMISALFMFIIITIWLVSWTFHIFFVTLP